MWYYFSILSFGHNGNSCCCTYCTNVTGFPATCKTDFNSATSLTSTLHFSKLPFWLCCVTNNEPIATILGRSHPDKVIHDIGNIFNLSKAIHPCSPFTMLLSEAVLSAKLVDLWPTLLQEGGDGFYHVYLL